MNMNLKPKSRAALSLLLALLLSICVGASAAADAGSPSSLPGEPTPLEDTVHVALLQGFGVSDPETAVHVKNVDEFLAALGSDRDILLAEGCYDLSTASDYGRDYADGPYTWREVYAADGEADGGSFELVIRDVRNLNIAGDTDDIRRVVLQAVPRYANVLCFENCQVTLGALTAGHTEAPGICAGGVLQLTGCSDCTVWSSRLYGCGVLGVEAQSCRKLRLLCDEIYDCSNGAVWARTCRDVRVENCSVHSCGMSYPVFREQHERLPACQFPRGEKQLFDAACKQLFRGGASAWLQLCLERCGDCGPLDPRRGPRGGRLRV